MTRPASPKSGNGRTRLRCAIYCRKSTEEGLDQEFNSLDAQRAACSAYIASQKHEGWIEIPTLYDDGGYSGGTMERPALQRLLSDIKDNKIDVVLTYKVDRLTRALSDFAKIVDVFDKHSVSFVSVTQQFNTTTSMGRLTLHVLLSFAQFEREVTGERIRDKIAASKAKGLWTGGCVSLGYDVKDRKLVVNPVEAETIRHIFRRYTELGSVRLLQAELTREGIKSKGRITRDGKPFGQNPLARGALYLMLQNPIYRGQIRHKDKVYPGEHEAIIDAALWKKVQATLEANRVRHELQPDSKAPSLLTGILYDYTGARLTPTHAFKKTGVRYRYYTSTPLITQGVEKVKGQRIPAEGLESLVIQRLAVWLSDANAVLSAFQHNHSETNPKPLIEKAKGLAREITDPTNSDRCQIVLGIVQRIDVHAERIEISLDGSRLGQRLSVEFLSSGPNGDRDNIALVIPVRLRRAGFEMRLVVDDRAAPANVSIPLVKLFVRALEIRDRLYGDPTLTIKDVARQVGIGSPYLTRLLRLAFLSPSITAAILDGVQPPELTARRLLDDTRLPLKWNEQSRALGFDVWSD